MTTATETLPAYDGRPPPAPRQSSATAARTTHTSALEDARGRAWLTLTVHSRAASAAASPAFFAGDTITGTVTLDLAAPERPKAVVVSVLAGTTAVGQEEQRFLALSAPLWPPPGGARTPLTGTHAWPFALALPPRVALPEGSFALPPTFSERASPAYVDYRIAVEYKRGALRVDKLLTTSFGFVPVAAPPLPSALRLRAYADGGALPGPAADPAGWRVLPPVVLRGRLFGTRDVEVTCTLAVATPLVYASGAPLPLHLALASGDADALAVLAAPAAPRVHLVRELATGSDAADDAGARRSNNTFRTSVGSAAFWPADGGAPAADEGAAGGARALHGEIDVRRGLTPAFRFPRVALRYALELVPSAAAGFVPAPAPAASSTGPTASGPAALLTVPVEIVAAQARGVAPRSFAPPGYEAPPVGDYNQSMGLLENGNQRFVHYHHGG